MKESGLEHESRYKFTIRDRTNGNIWWAEDREKTLALARILADDFAVRHNKPKGSVHPGYGTDVFISEYPRLPHDTYEEPVNYWSLAKFLEKYGNYVISDY